MYTTLKNLKNTEWVTPLKSIEFQGKLNDSHLNMKIRQIYKNDFYDNAEFVYLFPIPEEAVILDFKAKIGDKNIYVKIEEKTKAEKKYLDILKKGKKAVLLKNLRGNVFEISIGNVEKNQDVEIEISYLQEIKSIDSEQRLLIPAMIPPRYSSSFGNNGELKSNEILENQKYLDVNYRCSYALSLDLERKILEISSPSHKIIDNISEKKATVTLMEENCIPDSDFILKIRSEDIQEDKVFYGESNGEFFTKLKFTPMLPDGYINANREYLFLLDISGSMAGDKLEQAKQGLKIAMRNLEFGDLFNIVAFESNTYHFSQKSLPYNHENLEKASNWIDILESMGGTEIFPAIHFALDNRFDRNFEEIIFLFTDGEVMNEDEIVEFVQERSSNLQFHTFGIDDSVNTAFLNKLAEAGNGSSQFSYPNEDIDEKIVRQFTRINSKIYKNIELRMPDRILTVDDGIPDKIINSEPYSLSMKLPFKPKTPIRVMAGNDEILCIENIEKIEDCEILEKIWAKKNIESLEAVLRDYNVKRDKPSSIFLRIIQSITEFDMNQKYDGKNSNTVLKSLQNSSEKKERNKGFEKYIVDLKKEIVDISKKYGIISQETAFIGTIKNERENKEVKEKIIVQIAQPNPRNSFYNVADKGFREVLSFHGFEDPDHLLTERTDIETVMRNYDVTSLKNSRNIDIDWDITPLKKIAQEQNADGSFGKKEKIIATLKVLKRFSEECSELSLYRKQLEKALKYILSKKSEIEKNSEIQEKLNNLLEKENLKIIFPDLYMKF